MPRPLNGERAGFPTNGTGKTEYPHAKELSWTVNLQHIQKLVQNGSKTIKILEGSKGGNICGIRFGHGFFFSFLMTLLTYNSHVFGHFLMLGPWFEKQSMTGHIQKFFIKLAIQRVEFTHISSQVLVVWWFLVYTKSGRKLKHWEHGKKLHLHNMPMKQS